MHNLCVKKKLLFSENMKNSSLPAEVGVPSKHRPGQWVQTERSAHEAWAQLIARKPRAAMLMHHLVAQMGHQNAVVVSQKTLAKLMNVTDRTVRSAVADLVSEQWIQVIKMNGPGTVSAYVVNDRVAWGQRRDQLRLSVFSASVVADIDDQDNATLSHAGLRRIPSIYPGERQLPTGASTQPDEPDVDTDLPALHQR